MSASPRLRLALTAVALILALDGCGAVRRISRPSRPDPMPTVEQLQAHLSARRQIVHSLRGLARIEYRHPDGTNTSREALVVERPDRLRVEVLSLFGAVFVLTSQDGVFTAYARHEEKIYRGAASSQNMWRYARIGLPVPDLVDLVLGTPPQRSASWSDVTFDDDTGWVQLTQDLEGGALVIWFEDDLPRAAELRDTYGEVQWRAMFGKYRALDGVMIARRIKLVVPREDHTVKIHLDEIDVNPEIDANSFTFVVPDGTAVVELDPPPRGASPR